MAANVSISGRERHDEAVTYFFLGGCHELRRHMAGCLVCSGCRSAFEKGGCHYINRRVIQGRGSRAFQSGPRREPNDDEDTCTGSGEASRFLDLRSEKKKAGL